MNGDKIEKRQKKIKEAKKILDPEKLAKALKKL
jgi:hypothetical protein